MDLISPLYLKIRKSEGKKLIIKKIINNFWKYKIKN